MIFLLPDLKTGSDTQLSPSAAPGRFGLSVFSVRHGHESPSSRSPLGRRHRNHMNGLTFTGSALLCLRLCERDRDLERGAFRRAAVSRFVDVKSITEAWFGFGLQREKQKTSVLLSECVCLF